MNINRLLIIAGVILALSLGLLVVIIGTQHSTPAPVVPEPITSGATADPKNLSYTIAGEVVTLADGNARTPVAPGSAAVVSTSYFGNELVLDLNADGRDDTVFLLTQDGGGSGTFFYVVAALKTAEGYEGTEAVFVGDRIAPQNISAGPVTGSVMVNYADRVPGEPFTTAPSVGKSLYLKFNPQAKQWGELLSDFEGESTVPVVSGGSASVPAPEPVLVVDPAPTAALTAKTWYWVDAQYEDGRIVTPKRRDAFTLTFDPDGSFAITTDCNGGGGTYVTENGKLTFGEMMTTLMFCEGSQEGEYQQLLSAVSGYRISDEGDLILDLTFDSGVVTFR